MAVADVVISFLLLVSIFGILALGLNVKYGNTGLLDFGHVGFYLIGAYTSALFVLPPDQPDDFTVYLVGLGDVPILGSWITAIVAGTVVAGVVGGLVALPTIRLREDYLAITVLGVSVIFQRIVQSETWLANGPDALRGYSPPLLSLFPLTMDTPAGPLLFGLVATVVWAITTAGLSRSRPSGSWLPLDGVYTLVTFGLAGRNGGPLNSEAVTIAVASLVAGALSAVLLALVDPLLTLGVVLSLYSWFVLFVVLGDRYSDLAGREWAASVALGTGTLLALVPLPVVQNLTLKIAVTLGTLAVLVGAYYYGVTRVEWIRSIRLRGVGVAALWFVGIWYFVLPIVGPLAAGEVTGVLRTLFQNLVWVLKFGGETGIDYLVAGLGALTVQLDYSRFQLAGFALFIAGLYYVLEITVQSPFGRVLRAIRNDENVVKSLGKDPFVYKIQSMVIGSALGGFAGALWTMYAQGLTFRTFAPRITFITLLIVFLGGVGNNRGVILGAGIFWAFQQATTQLASFFPPAIRVNIQAFRLVVVGVLFIIILYYLPEGLLGRAGYSAGATEGTRGGGGGREATEAGAATDPDVSADTAPSSTDGGEVSER